MLVFWVQIRGVWSVMTTFNDVGRSGPSWAWNRVHFEFTRNSESKVWLVSSLFELIEQNFEL